MKYPIDRQVKIISKNIVGTVHDVSDAVGEKTLYGVFANGKIYSNILGSDLEPVKTKKVDEKMSGWAKKGRERLIQRLGSAEAVSAYFRNMVAQRRDRKKK